eukprot:12440665-Alexandrium_andersonii.AAC.1
MSLRDDPKKPQGPKGRTQSRISMPTVLIKITGHNNRAARKGPEVGKEPAPSPHRPKHAGIQQPCKRGKGGPQ